MPHRNRVIIIAHDARIIGVMLEASGFLTESIGLRQNGPNAEIHELSDEQFAEVEHFLGAADIQFFTERTSAKSRPRYGRHSAP